MKRAIVFIHGATNRRKGESPNVLKLIEKLKEFSPKTDKYINIEWSNLVQKEQDHLYSRRFEDWKKTSIFSPISKIINIIRKEIVFGFCCDSISYEKTLKKDIVPIVKEKLTELEENYNHIVVIGWSMGAAIAYESLKQLSEEERSFNFELVTMGCNIPLNYMECYYKPKFVEWSNVNHAWDVLGMKLNRPHITEHTFKTFRPFTAHTSYFHDKKALDIIRDILVI